MSSPSASSLSNLEAIEKKAQQVAARKGGASTEYWFAANPSKNTILLSGATNKKNFDKVYLPEYRVVGTPEEIARMFRNAGVSSIQVGEVARLTGSGARGSVSPTAANISAASFSGANPQHAEALKRMFPKKVSSTRASTAKKTHPSYEEYAAIAASVANEAGYSVPQSIVKQEGKVRLRAKSPGSKKSSKAKSPRAGPADTFNKLMAAALRGEALTKVIDTKKYDAVKHTGAVQKKASKDPKTPYPTIMVGGRSVTVPLSAPVNANYINDVVRQSQYAQYADEISSGRARAGAQTQRIAMSTPPRAKTPSPATSPRAVASSSQIGRALSPVRSPVANSPRLSQTVRPASMRSVAPVASMSGSMGGMNAGDLEDLLAGAAEVGF